MYVRSAESFGILSVEKNWVSQIWSLVPFVWRVHEFRGQKWSLGR